MKTRCLVLAVVLLSLFAALSAHAQSAPLYIRQFGSAQMDYIKGVGADGLGNVYVAGTTHGAIGTAPDGTANMNRGGSDAFLAKLNADGEILWVVQFGSAADDVVTAIAVNNLRGVTSVYVAGWTRGSIPNAGRPRTAGESDADAFLAKIHESGSIQWVRQVGSSGDDFANAVAVDRSGLVYVVGSTAGSLDGTSTPDNGRDAFIARFDGTGLLWPTIPQFSIASHPNGTSAYGVAVDVSTSNDYLFVTGIAQGEDSASMFVAKFDIWLERWRTAVLAGPRAGSESVVGRAIAVDSRGNVAVAGSTRGSFDGNAWSGGEDIVVMKFTSGLTKLWSVQYGTDSNDCAYGVAFDAENSIYVTGITGHPSSGYGLEGQRPLGGHDIFLTRLASEDGRRVFTRQLGSPMQDWSYAAAVDGSGNVYLAGATEGDLAGQGNGSIDAVLIKYGPDGPVPPPVTEFSIDGTVREIPSGEGLEGVSISITDEGGQVVADTSTDRQGRFSAKVKKAGNYFIRKLKIGYTARVNPDVVQVSEASPAIAPVLDMERIVIPSSMTFRKGYNTVRFEKLPASDRSVQGVFGPYAGNPYVGLIFSFQRPMQFLILAKPRFAGNLKALEFDRSYLIYTGRAFTIDTTSWVSRPPAAAPTAPSHGMGR